MSLRQFTIVTSALVLTVGAAQAQKQEKPNIVVILADDVGSGDISYYTKKFMKKKPIFETPAIDELAKNGMWFTDSHSSTSLCSPTRYCVMSGNNNYRSYAPWGVWGTFRENAIKPGQTTMASVVKSAGYSTGFIGKWHLGGDFKELDSDNVYRGDDRSEQAINADMTKMIGGGPSSLGFDYSYNLPCGIQGPIYMAFENEKWAPFEKNSKIIPLTSKTAIDPEIISDKGPGMGDSQWDTTKIADIISKKAVGFINDNAPKENPFFLYYCSPMAHRPHMPTDKLDGKKIKGATPSRHMDTIVELDVQVKRIIKALKKNKVYKNTLIIFTTDNGGLTWKVPGTLESGHKPSGIYRGSKNAPHEGGHRVPFIASWPGKIKKGVTSDEPIINHDILATMAAVVGTEVPKDEAMDSMNILPILTGKKNFKQREYLVQQAGAGCQIMFREKGWKLIVQSDHHCSKWVPIGLFNLKDNVREKESGNKVKHPEYKARVDAMLKKYLEIRNSGVRTTPINK